MDSSENGNLLRSSMGRFKRMELEKVAVLLASESHIDPNPHQINAFCAAIDAMKTGGMVLADEVGLERQSRRASSCATCWNWLRGIDSASRIPPQAVGAGT